MTRELLVAFVSGWIGSTLILSRVRWFRSPALVDRLRPYSPGGLAEPSAGGFLSGSSIREVVTPMLGQMGERVARTLGVNDDIGVRLRRAGSAVDANGFRVQQGAVALAAFGTVASIAWFVSLSPAFALVGLVTAPPWRSWSWNSASSTPRSSGRSS